MSCAICETRKEKRFCPAVHGRICPQCCGEQREVTLDCPSDCVYLQQAREHEKPRPLDEADHAALLPEVTIPQQFLYEHQHLITGLSYAVSRATRTDPALRDLEIMTALGAMAKSWHTRVNSGLHYELPMGGIGQQAVAAQIQQMLQEYREAEQKHLGYSRLRDSDVLLALVFLVRMAYSRTSGRPKSRAFVDFLSAQFAERQAELAASSEPPGRIVLP